MLSFALGFISGILVTIACLIATWRHAARIEHVRNMVETRQILIGEPKVEIIEPTSELEETLAQNDAKGQDTKMDGIE